jgi:hypothetical protein
MPTRAEFLADKQGKQFVDVLNDRRVDFERVLAFFDDPARRRRMEEAEGIHGRPALAGVIGELEDLPDVDRFFRSEDAHRTYRFRQAVGVVARMVMEQLGWSRTGVKGSLGRRAKVPAGTSTPGAYINVSGPSHWFNRAEHYRPPAVVPRGPTSGPSPADPERPPTPCVDALGRLLPLSPEQRRQQAERSRAALLRVAGMGTPQEQRKDLEHLMGALAETRRLEGRPF